MKKNISKNWQLRLYPDSVLRQKARPVTEINQSVNDLIKGMAQLMYRYNGIGFAAPQVGILQRIIIADIGGGLISLINPEITRDVGFEKKEEGCLSLPEIQVDISRSLNILVKGTNLDGNEIALELSGLMARVIQHEMDHLNGKLIIDHASSVDRYIFNKQLDYLKMGYPYL